MAFEDQSSEAGIISQRERVATLKKALAALGSPEAARLTLVADYLVKKSVWLVGGDGWAYDIGYGGLDHVLASHWDVNLLVLDTGVYSNTGGQQSKATPLGAAAKFAVAGRDLPKKDLGMMVMGYGHAYVAQIAFGAKDTQTVRAFLEADAHPGPSLLIAYSHCIAHGYDMAYGVDTQKLAVNSGAWPLYRFDPRRLPQCEPPLHRQGLCHGEGLMQALSWMAWTRPVALFFIGIALTLIAMTVWEVWRPSVARRGLLRIPTTRGDRLFIALMAAAWLNLAWTALIELSQWWAAGLSGVLLVVIMRWG